MKRISKKVPEKLKLLFLCISLLAFAGMGILAYFVFFHSSPKTGGYITFTKQRCQCDAETKHSSLALSYEYVSESSQLAVIVHCDKCYEEIGRYEVTLYPASVGGSVFEVVGGNAAAYPINCTMQIGNEPIIYEEIKSLSGVSNVAALDKNVLKLISVLDLYEYSSCGWTKELLNALGIFTADAYRITFDPNGGAGIMEAKSFVTGVLPECHYMRDGFLFAGWSLEKDGELAFSDGEYVSLSKNVTLYARWERNPYSIDVTVNNFEYGDARILSLYGKNLTIEATPKYGHRFLGWYDKNNLLLSPDATLCFALPMADIYYEARFEPIEGRVYVIDGGTGCYGESESCLAGTTIDIYAGIRTGYDFGEWVITKGGSSLSMEAPQNPRTSFVMPEDDVVLTATWREISGITAELNSNFTSLYCGSEYTNGLCYDIDKGITIRPSMVSVYVEFRNGTRRLADNFSMETSMIKNIGTNSIPIVVTLNGVTYTTELIIHGYSATLFKLMEAAGVDADSFQSLTILISNIQNGLLYINNSISLYQNKLDDIRTEYTSKSKDRTELLNELSTLRANMTTLAMQCANYEADIESVAQRTRTLINTYKGVNSQAISDAFTALAIQIKGLTDQVLYTGEAQDFLLNQYTDLKNDISK